VRALDIADVAVLEVRADAAIHIIQARRQLGPPSHLRTRSHGPPDPLRIRQPFPGGAEDPAERLVDGPSRRGEIQHRLFDLDTGREQSGDAARFVPGQPGG
jgi:hypothetical protein